MPDDDVQDQRYPLPQDEETGKKNRLSVPNFVGLPEPEPDNNVNPNDVVVCVGHQKPEVIEKVNKEDTQEQAVQHGASTDTINNRDTTMADRMNTKQRILPSSLYNTNKMKEALDIVEHSNLPDKSREVISAILQLGKDPRNDGELRSRAKRHPGGLALMQVLGVSTGGKIRNKDEFEELKNAYYSLPKEDIDLHPYHHENDALPALPSISSYKHTPSYSDYSGSYDFQKIKKETGHTLPEAGNGEEGAHEHVLVCTNTEEVWKTYEQAKGHHSVTSSHHDPHDLLDDKFVDHEFPPAPKSLFENGKSRRVTDGVMAKLAVTEMFGCKPELTWFREDSVLQRPDDLAKSGSKKPSSKQAAVQNAITYAKEEPWSVFTQKISPEDVSQGALGNCWFVGSLSSVLSIAPRLVKRLFRDERSRTGRVNEYGAYVIRYCEGGRWVDVVIDDLLPCAQVPSLERGFLAFSGARGNQLFVPLLEKILAKNRGCYEKIEGGRPGEGLRIFTGWPTQVLHLQHSEQTDHDINRAVQLNANRRSAYARRTSSMVTDPQAYAKHLALRIDANCPFISWEYVWVRMRHASELGMICAAACGHSDQILAKCGGDQKAMRTHYRQVGLSPSHCYSVMQCVECQGGNLRLMQFRNPWGAGRVWTGAYGNKSDKWTRELINEIGAEKLNLGAEGMFWMQLEDVLQYFVSCAISCWRHGWHEERFTVALPNTLEEPQPAFICSGKDATEAILSLMQTEENCLETLFVMDLGIVVLNAKTRQFIGSTHRAALDTCIMEEMLTHEEGMVPHSHEFTFAVFSAKPVITRPVQVDGTAVRDAIVMHIKKYGKCTERAQDCFVYATEDGGFSFYIENHASNSSVASVCALETWTNLHLSRDHSAVPEKGLRCDDIIPPNTGMLVLLAAERPGGCQWSLASSVKQLGHVYKQIVHSPALVKNDALHTPFKLTPNTAITSSDIAWAQPQTKKTIAPQSWHPQRR